ncbi:MAG: RNA polymerase sigma factor [Anaerolineales bacterium]|nr:MAG: RNA polymerase sigma factor [Anaerolineales bacterium]
MDAQTLARCKAGDPQAIESLVLEHKDRLFRFCLSILDDPADAEDATQESFIAALKALKNYRQESSFQTWLFSIALNTCRGQLRQRTRRARLAAASQPLHRQQAESSNPERAAIAHEHSHAMWQAISRLDEKHRLPVILRYYHELSTQEIAEVLGINLGTVHSRLSIARQHLGAELRQANRPKRAAR